MRWAMLDEEACDGEKKMSTFHMVPSKRERFFCVAEDLGAFVWLLLRCESASYLHMSQDARLPPAHEDNHNLRLRLHGGAHFEALFPRHCST